MTEDANFPVHVAYAWFPYLGKCALYLKKEESGLFCWFIEKGKRHEKTSLEASSIEEAIRLGRNEWKIYNFQTLNCGFRYTLPERDEHGMNALFFQMAASYSSPNGVYFDSEVGNNCYVNFASQEALSLWRTWTLPSKIKETLKS